MHPHLTQLLSDNGGALSIEHFMREALYHPEHGYYTCHAATVGRSGDFSTSATLHPILGQAIGRWLLRRRSRLTRKHQWHVIELGAGNGAMAQSVLQSIGWWHRRGLQYHIVETSPRLTQLQQAALRGFAVNWHPTIRDALHLSNGEALIFSNEFVDAFPCRVLQRQNDNWSEVFTIMGAEGWQEQLKPFTSDDPIAGLLASFPPDTQRIELHDSYRQWLLDWAPLLTRGAILTIDYGDMIDNLYHRRPRGTIRAYFQHQRIEGQEIFDRFGRQDLTADVNFSHLIDWGTSVGWKTEFLHTQREFVLTECPHAQQKSLKDPKLAYLLDYDGPGQAFKVLSQIQLEP